MLEPVDLDRWKKRKRTFLRPKYFEDLRTHRIAAFITQKVIEDGIAPKTANRYREVIMRVLAWKFE